MTDRSSGRLRVSAVSYLNTVPLVWGMLHGAQRGLFDLTYDIPAGCAARLAAGEADIGIVPVAELPRLELEVIPGAGIACHGAVRSILLVTKVPPEEIQTLAADSSSRTSTALVRILLAERFGVKPALSVMQPNLGAMLAACDAALLIGDSALRVDPLATPYAVLDLGEEWHKMTGLPFVFAVWAGRQGCVTPEVTAAFLDSARFGLAHIDEIVLCESEKRGLSRELAREYLTRRVVFELGESEYGAMRRFLEYAGKLS